MKRTLVAVLIIAAATGIVAAHEGHEHGAVAPGNGGGATAVNRPKDIEDALNRYWSAMESRSLEKLADVLDPDLLVLEGAHKNVGWADYRDSHIGEHFKEWTVFKVIAVKTLEISTSGTLAYAAQESTFQVETLKGSGVSDGLETFVLRKGPAGWKIKLIQSSSKKRDSPGEK